MSRLLLEGAAIVASILLAFAIQAWWENRGERVEERRSLTAVMEELDANRDHLTRSIAWHSGIQQATDALLELSVRGPRDIAADSVDHLLGDISWWEEFALQTDAVDALVLSGRLSLVRDELLRRALTRWQGAVDELRQRVTQDYDHYLLVLLPYLRAHADVVQINNATTHQPGSDEQDYSDPVPLREQLDHRSLLSQREFRNMLMQKRWVQDDILEAYQAISPQLAGLIDMLQHHLEPEAP